tara:strand:- start:25 stop:495 length:471 start_codon:yes stop_codon:yes gene_type:complete
MRRLLLILCLTVAVLLGSAGEGWSADFQKGWDAYNRGDYANALREWRPLAEQGRVSAQFNLGWMYEYGKGVPKDYKTAVRWYRRAAVQRHAGTHFYGGVAQAALGKAYFLGQGVPQDFSEALKWLRKAARQGTVDAYGPLVAIMYLDIEVSIGVEL